MFRTRAVALASLAFVLAACGGTAGPSTPAANRVTVLVDAKQPSGQPLNLFATAYFPDQLSAHPGDTVDFKVQYTGEPHTVTLGKLVDADLAATAKLGPAGPPPGSPPLPEQQKLPLLVGQPKGGPPPISQSAGQPCFLATGEPAAIDACSKDQQKQTDFDGTQTFYNSGFLGQDAVFTMKLADGIKPGTYGFFCLLHREAMQGKVTVVDKGQSVPSADDVKKSGDEQQKKLVQAFQAPNDATAQATPDKAVAGILDSTGKIQNAGVSVFGPKEASIPVGGSVKWLIQGAHTISFGATAADSGTLLAKGSDGTIAFTPKGVAPAGGPPAPQAPAPSGPPSGPPAIIPYNGGAFNGQGFHSTGLVLSFPPAFYLYSLKFTAAGTYKYRCLVHPDMEGTVKVG
ncbi:MAG TPA: hypothetical protein VIN56_04105 [Candidatus Dormibacteraeota bacterium]|jgi:plastocyanin